GMRSRYFGSGPSPAINCPSCTTFGSGGVGGVGGTGGAAMAYPRPRPRSEIGPTASCPSPCWPMLRGRRVPAWLYGPACPPRYRKRGGFQNIPFRLLVSLRGSRTPDGFGANLLIETLDAILPPPPR